MRLFYKIVTTATSLLFIYLTVQLLFASDAFVQDMGMQPSAATAVLAKRAAMFMVGISIMMFASRNLPYSHARRIICLATGVTLFGLSIMGTYELIRGTVNHTIIVAITIETILWMSFGFILLKDNPSEATRLPSTDKQST